MILTMIFELNLTELKRLGTSFFIDNGDDYLKLYRICHEKCRYLGTYSIMLALLNLALKCLSSSKNSRPYLDWLCIILKNLTFISDEAFK